jgi:hypothetical protein
MDIEQLIEKFYEGLSTPEEERFLTAYFLNEEAVDERWKDERQLFSHLHETQIQVPAGVSERLEKSIMQMEVQPEVFQNPLPRKRTWYYWIGSAAAIVLLCIGLFFINRKPSPPTMADTFSDPEEAALVAEQTLAYMSAQLNKGLDIVADAGQEFVKVNQLLNNHLNK